MEFRQVSGNVLETSTDLLVLGTFGEPGSDSTFKAVDALIEGDLAAQASEEHFAGQPGERLLVRSPELAARRILVLGLGPKADFQLASMRDMAAAAIESARASSAKSVMLILPSLPASKTDRATQLAAEGAVLGSYRFDKYLSGQQGKPPLVLESFSVASDIKKKLPAAKARSAREALKRGEAVGRAICLARDFVNEPAEYMTPVQLAEEAKAIAKRHTTLKAKVLGVKEIEKLSMGMFLAVGKGSDHEPRLIHLTYTPKKKASKKVALIGKGITFDSGGYSLKPSSAMEDMKIDMAGSAAVIAAMDALAALDCPHEVHAIVAACENMVSGRAYRLGDVLQAMDGTTVEINNTDAEGRLTLGDAISYARANVEPDEMLDFATLTGACMVALGPYTAAVMSTSESMAKAWLKAADEAGEDMWRMPLSARLKEQLKSAIADMRNTGERWGGAITAGLFLQNFVKDTPWVHVDIAGPASAAKPSGAVAKGGTGFAVATIVEYLSR